MNQNSTRFVLDAFQTMRERVFQTIGYIPENGSHDDIVVTTSIIVGTLIGIGADATPLYDSNDTLYGFSVEGIEFYLMMDKSRMGA